MDGWVKLHRKVIESSVFDNPDLLKLWVWMLCKSSHSDREQIVGLKTVHLAPGQFIFGRNAAAGALNMPPSKIYRLLKLLESGGKIEVKSNNHFSVVTLVNWGFYQGSEGADQIANEQQMNNRRTADEQPTNTDNNVRIPELKNEKKKRESFSPPSYEEVAAYCNERRNGIDPQQFIDFYTAKGWLIGRNRMKDWRAAVRTWEQRRGGKANGRSSSTENEWAGYNGVEL